ncbi:MAG: T9SS type A sorting domain-containing protein, partial [Candidatus Eisenbacteria bacterium]
QRAGFVATTDVPNSPTFAANGPTLHGNDPNPFRRGTVITYQLRDPGPVTLELEDVTGRRVKNLYSGEQSAGTHTFELTSEDLPSGVYYYRLTQGRVSQRHACVVLR